MGLGFLLIACSVNQTGSDSKEEAGLSEKEVGEMKEFMKKRRGLKDENRERIVKLKKTQQIVKADLQVEEKGEEIILSYTVENRSGNDLHLIFPSGQEFDYLIYNQNNELVYRWSDGKMFIMAIHETILPAGEKIEIREVWDGRDKNGNPVPPGKYRVIFLLKARAKTADDVEISEKAFEATSGNRNKRKIKGATNYGELQIYIKGGSLSSTFKYSV